MMLAENRKTFEGPPNLDFGVSVHTIHQIDHTPGKVKKVEILKNEAQNEAGIFWQNLIFEMKFFSKASTNFSMDFSNVM